MIIDLYTWSWNDEDRLGFLFTHYDRLVRRYVIYDDGSDDGTLEILRANPKVEIRPIRFMGSGDSFILSVMPTIQACWKESRGTADWVIVTEIDEHLWHPDLEAYLEACRSAGITMIPALGYQMIDEVFPPAGAWLCKVATMGAPWDRMSKVNIFAPDAIEEINYTLGRHIAHATGRVVAPDRDELMLLHYKYLDFEHTYARHQAMHARLQPADLANNWAFRWAYSREKLREDWAAFASRAVDVSRPDFKPWQSHLEPRWWDGYRRRYLAREARESLERGAAIGDFA
jgi:hypothetical protein